MLSGRMLTFLAIALFAGSLSHAVARQALTSHTLAGRVTGEGGEPLPRVSVELANPAASGSVRTVVTDQDGRYRIENLFPGVYVLTFRAAGYGIAIRDIEIGGGGREFEYDVELRRAAGGTPAAPAPAGPSRRVICGMTVVTPPGNVDPKIQAPRLPVPEGRQVKPTIRAVQPTLCWEAPSTPARRR